MEYICIKYSTKIKPNPNHLFTITKVITKLHCKNIHGVYNTSVSPLDYVIQLEEILPLDSAIYQW